MIHQEYVFKITQELEMYPHISKVRQILLCMIISLLLLACGNSNPANEAVDLVPPKQKPSNTIIFSSFRDTNGSSGILSGEIMFELSDAEVLNTSATTSIWVYWADSFGHEMGESWLKTNIC